MNWQTTTTILSVLGVLGLLVGVMLQFKFGRWILGLILAVMALASLFTGDWSDPGSGADFDPQKASRYWLIGGGCCLLLATVAHLLAGN